MFYKWKDSKKIKNKDEKEYSNKLILMKYRINEGSYQLKFERIAIGKDIGYSSSKIYPKNSKIPKLSDIIIEGREEIISNKF